MSVDVYFRADIEPCPKGRPRFGRTKAGAPVTFTPEKTRRWESDFAALAAQHMPKALIDEPVFLGTVFVLRRPQRLMRARDPEGRIYAASRPDLDNLEKAVMDALSSWWRDDSLVVAHSAEKVYAAKGEQPHVEVSICSIASIGCVA